MDAAAFTQRYEQLRAIATSGNAGGWRHGLGVLAVKGIVCWMAAWAALPAVVPAATPQADASLSTSTPSLSAPASEGGSSSSACVSPPLTASIVAVLAQMTLAHARDTVSPEQSLDQEARPP